MSSQARVQSYLERHKISGLFEELMSKIIHSQPDDPLIFLSAVIERKIDRKRGSPAVNRKSTGDLDKGGKVSWADNSLAVAKDRGYEKPWLTNTRRSKPSKQLSPERGRPPVSSQERKIWNPDTKVQSADFDEIWGGEKPKLIRDRSRSRERTRSMDDPNALTFQSSGYRGPVHQRNGDSMADEELPIQKQGQVVVDASPVVMSSKFKSQNHKANRHRSELKQLVISQQKMYDSGIDEDDSRFDEVTDDAVDVAEDIDDLRNEGLRNVKTTGIRLAKVYNVEPQPLVRVSICSRCARVITGSDPVTSNTEEGNEVNSQPNSAVRFTPRPVSDDEFESVSQVSGPRRPVWQAETDAESQALSPRKGTPMYESSGLPHKGRPMYQLEQQTSIESVKSSPMSAPPASVVATESVVTLPPPRPPTPNTQRSDATAPLPAARNAWNRKDSIDFEERNVDTPELLASKGRSWAIPDDSEVSDIDWEKDRANITKFKSHKPKKYTGGQY